jgi:hypothetical protein
VKKRRLKSEKRLEEKTRELQKRIAELKMMGLKKETERLKKNRKGIKLKNT